MSTQEPNGVLVELDGRRRVALGRLGRHERYLVTEHPDGTLVWSPAVVVTEAELRLHRNPALLADIEESLAHPEQGIADRPRRDARQSES